MSSLTKLNLWIMPNAGFETRRVMQREIAFFRKENPGIEVNITVQPWFFAWDRLIAVAKRRDFQEFPDVIQIGGTWTTTLAALGALVDLSDYLNDLVRPSWNYCYEPTRTKAYSLPWFLDARVLYYRHDILKELGIKPQDIATWKGLRDACEQLRDHPNLGKKYCARALAGQREGVLMHDLAPWVWGAGGNFLSSTRQKALFDEPSALKGIDFYFKLLVDHLIPLMGRDRILTGNFFSGQFGFQVSGAWPINSAFNPQHPHYSPEVSKHYGVSVFPAGPAGQVTYLGGSNLAIVSTTKHPEAAWALIKFLTGPASQVRHSRQIGMLPSRYTALEELLSIAPPTVAEVFRQSLRVARTFPCAATLGTLERILGRVSLNLITAVRENRYNEKVVADQLSAAAKEANYILSLYE